jgi:hypothetical protein
MANTRTEDRTETCDNCGWTREREWRVAKGSPSPCGYRVDKVTGAWKIVSAPTRFVTLCGCDT